MSAGLQLGEILLPTFANMLRALSGWLEKAEAQLGTGEAEALLGARLAPDMFPLATQVRFACVQALEPTYRLRGAEYPEFLGSWLDEGRAAGERPGTLAEARKRIAEALRLIEDLPPGALDRDESEALAHVLPMGMTFELSAGQYARDWSMGQFYFHVMTAYAILRSHGVALGKADYIPHLIPYLRQPVSPAQP